MISPSAGTARVLGFNSIHIDDPPTCAYLMVGRECAGSCRFCAQRRREGGKGDDFRLKKLSRITWDALPDDEVIGAVAREYREGAVKRVCFQVVRGDGFYRQTLDLIKELKSLCPVPVCVSITCVSRDNISALLHAGAEKVAFSFDAATPRLYREIKEREWQEEWELYLEITELHPGRTVIHIIAGLGETGGDILRAVEAFHRHGSPVSLFAFTPVRGTPLAGRKPPSMGYYRSLQAALYLVESDLVSCRNEVPGKASSNAALFDKREYTDIIDDLQGNNEYYFADHLKMNINLNDCDVLSPIFNVKDGKILFNPIHRKNLARILSPEAFQTRGCPDCNRPLYNERPGRVPYNYPRPLNMEEMQLAIEEIFKEGSV